jgi:putative endonuclease
MDSLTKPWFVYIIQTKDQTFYTGITVDLPRRMQQHLNGTGAKYLRGKQPLQLVFSVMVKSRSAASKLECKIKKLTKTQKQSIIDGNLSLE